MSIQLLLGLFFWPRHVAYGIFVPQLRIASPALEVWRLNHWATREILEQFLKTLPAPNTPNELHWPLCTNQGAVYL